VGALGISSLRAWILAASLLAVSAIAHGAGLGKLNVTSALGEPLNAEIELFAEKKEINSLAARLASPEAFGRAGLVYSNVLDNAKVSIEKRANGEPYVRLTTTQPVNEPFVDLLMELSWASGRISREFTALLDPPSLIAERAKQKAAEAEVRASPPKPEPQPEPIAEPPAAEAPAQKTPPAEAPAAQAPAAQAPAEPEAPVTAEAPASEPVPSAPVETIGGPMATFLTERNISSTSRRSAPASAATGESYGPVRRGETLAKIAAATKPADVSLDQMLVLLFRENPQAFVGKNMSRLKTGTILKLPSSDQYGSITPADARKEVLVQARDWNAYREQLAAKAGEAMPTAEPAQQAAAGKITPKVEDQGAAAKQQPQEVLKLSQGDPAASAGSPTGDAKAGQGQTQARVRALEEELVARDKAVKEANERVGKLEKTIKDLQALLEIKNKGMSDLQKPVAPPPAVAAPAQPPASKPSPKTGAAPQTVTPAAPGPEAKPAPAPAPTAPPAPLPKTETAPPTQPAPPPKAAPRPAQPPRPAPSVLDRVLEQPAYLAAGLGVLVLIGALAVRAVKRRRESRGEPEEAGPAPVVGAAAPASSPAPAYSSTDTDLRSVNARAANITEEVDPVAEAEIFLAYGRDAQAEDLLKEALAASPRRYEIHLKLLQIYANRKDTRAFEQLARELQQGTGGGGDIWDQAVRMGYQIDPDNPRYAAGQPSGGEAATTTAVASAGGADNVDFNIGFEDPNATTATDIDLGDDGRQFDKTQVIDPAAMESHDDTTILEPGAAPTINFSVELPPAGATADATAPPKKQEGNAIDFDFDLNALAAPSASVPAAEEPKPGGLDFDMSSGASLEGSGEPGTGSSAVQEIDLSGINLDLGTGTSPQVSATGKDDRWYDVQTKFDLAKAYQEMGDKDGAREILKEVLQEGDAEQKAAASAVLANLDS
jgi:pilus assembly protein FimV